MKTPLIYGLYLALANLLLNVLLYLFGAHESVESLKSAQGPVGLVSMALCVGAIALAIREKRALTPPDQPWGYGAALGTGVLTVLVGMMIGIVMSYVYYAFINPGIGELLLQLQLEPMQANGRPPAEIARIEETMRKYMTPAGMAAVVGFMGFLMGSVLALITAIFFRNRPAGATETTLA